MAFKVSVRIKIDPPCAPIPPDPINDARSLISDLIAGSSHLSQQGVGSTTNQSGGLVEFTFHTKTESLDETKKAFEDFLQKNEFPHPMTVNCIHSDHLETLIDYRVPA